MPNSPRIQSLPVQTAQILKQRILDGQYQHTIPGEPALAKDLQVSRSTLRKALAQLTAEKILSPPPCR